MTLFHIDANGRLLRSTSDHDVAINGAVETTEIAPDSGLQHWNGTGWDALPPIDLTSNDLTAEELADILVDDGTLNRGQVTAKKNSRRP